MIAISDGETDVTTNNLQTKGYIQTIPKSKSNNGKDFIITKSEKGDEVTVTIDKETFYPKTETSKTETNKTE